MDKEFIKSINRISRNLAEIGSFSLPVDNEQVGILKPEWWDGICAFNDITSQELTMCIEEQDEYQKIKARFQAQKAKILSLGLEYPDIE